MPESKSTLALEIAGQRFEGWERASFAFDMENLVHTFSFDLFDSGSVLSVSADSFPAGQACNVSVINSLRSTREQLLSGYIVRRKRSRAGTSNTLSVEGADSLVDLIDCSATHASRTWIKMPFSRIVQDLATPFKVVVNPGLIVGLLDPLIDKFTLQSGETAFDAIERLCRSQGVLPLSNFDGTLDLANAATAADRAAVELVEGRNILMLDETIDWSDRYSDYIVLGQSAGGGKKWTKEMLQAGATAQDAGVKRYRPKMIISENKATQEILLKRVRWEAQVRAGRATVYAVTVRGWYQTNAAGLPLALWAKNKRVSLIYPTWKMVEDLLITRVEFNLDSNGERTTLTLKPPDIFAPQPGEQVGLT